ncbi:uncharacterized protein LOC120417395 [Culex pipiens pallens]|uniref:uncharacterized protein LOC120417395 n=1 Tax=Culex pipiens pallens TaxID=42434 RepID=UPI001952F440|nr:uncharacterized protein LOC120417395 [Culex pipiens pallens]
MVDNFVCAGYTFYSKFDSGNLGRVELVRCCEGLNIIGNNVSSTSPAPPSSASAPPAVVAASIPPPANRASSPPALVPAEPPAVAALHHPPSSAAAAAALFVEVEFNLWTRPDCAGTPYENQNRTWFYFAVTGGRPNQIVKFNVMNLNKQAKLFSQGMHPVMKVGPGGRWERIKDKPSYAIANDVFFISFLHRAPESPETRTYYAFTFPFTYNELLEQLGNFDKRFGRHPFDMHQIAVEVAQRYDSSAAAGPVEVVSAPLVTSSKKGKLAKVAKTIERSGPESFDDTARDGSGMEDAGVVLPKEQDPVKPLDSAELASAMSIDDNNTSESMQQITNLVNKVKIELPQQSAESAKGKLLFLQRMLKTPTLDDEARATNLDQRDDIYYYRELLTHSVEHRRVELLTITSFHGVQPEREPRLRNLFPDERTPRCHTFKNKKIVFISSRVHPGETPASFVLNGFLSVLLDRKSIVAITLRRMYVFKIIPFLNPDGVYNGLYRSDTRGHNLNRVYLTPNIETQPSIYASRKLIRYFHLGTDEPEPYELEQEKKAALLKSSADTSTEEFIQQHSTLEEKPPTLAEEQQQTKTSDPGPSSPSAVKKDSESTEENTPSTSDSGFGEGQPNLSKSSTISDSSSTLTLLASVDPLVMSLVPTAASLEPPKDPEPKPEPEAATIATNEEVLPPPKVFTEQLIPDLLPVVTESQGTSSVVAPVQAGLTRPVRSASNLSTASSMASQTVQKKITAKVDTGRKGSLKSATMNKPNLIATTPNTLKMKDFGVGQVGQQQQQPSSALAVTGTKTAKKSSSSSLHHKRAEGKMRPQTPQMYSHFRSHRNEFLNPASQKNLNISLDYLAQLDEKNDKVIYEEKSNMFLYIDLHGHASKKGVFMYGNHLPSTIEAIECMLLPRLMSVNSLHFHYDACNFSERNMYYKGKRDGLSKEGSGRVAIYKCSGLIKSYTLECNYNTGKSVNQLPPRGKEGSTNKVQSPVPPKYTPAVFEEVGRALGPSILDLTNSNPASRLPNSEFRTLQGLRNTLRIEIERGSSKARVTNKVPKTHSKRLSNQSSSSLDVAKENALQWESGPAVGICGPALGAAGVAAAAAVVGSGSPTGAGSSGEPLGGNGNSCSATSSGGRQFLKGGVGAGVSGKTHSGKISRKGVGVGGKGFGKKDAVKKTKILCESGVAVGAVVAAGGKKLQELMRAKDQHQVPRKKIKVSPPHQPQLSTVDGFDLCFKSTGLSATSLPNFLAAPPSLGELPLSKKVKSEAKLLEECLDCDDSLDAPCCSYSSSLPSTTAAVATTKLIATYSPAGSPGSDIGVPSSPPSSGSGCSSSGGGVGGSNVDGTSSAGSKAGKISKFSKATSAKSKLGKSSDGSGKLLKKKRSLKTDSNLKRKKTRVKPALT